MELMFRRVQLDVDPAKLPVELVHLNNLSFTSTRPCSERPFRVTRRRECTSCLPYRSLAREALYLVPVDSHENPTVSLELKIGRLRDRVSLEYMCYYPKTTCSLQPPRFHYYYFKPRASTEASVLVYVFEKTKPI